MPSARTNARFAEVLLKAGLTDELQLRSALSNVDKFNWSVARAVADLSGIDEEALVETLAKSVNVPAAQLGNHLKDNGALKSIPVDFCEKHVVFPMSLTSKMLTLAMADPTDLPIIDQAKVLAGTRVSIVMAAESQIRAAIAKHYRGQDLVSARRKSVSGARVDPRLRGQLAEAELSREASPMPPAEPMRQGEAMLDAEVLGELEAPALTFSADEQRRLEAARQNQEKVAHILRTVQEL